MCSAKIGHEPVDSIDWTIRVGLVLDNQLGDHPGKRSGQ
jgi:hypothetical protein